MVAGNGDYRTIVLAPCNIQEAVDLTQEAFDLADCYRNPVVVLADGMIGQMMEPIEWHDIPKRELPPKDWAASGRNGRAHNNFVTSLFIEAQACEEHDLAIQAKYDLIEEREIRWEEKNTQDCQVLLVAYGTPSRIAMVRHRATGGAGRQSRSVPTHYPVALPLCGAEKGSQSGQRPGCADRGDEPGADGRRCSSGCRGGKACLFRGPCRRAAFPR